MQEVNNLTREQLIELVLDQRADLKTLKDNVFSIVKEFDLVDDAGEFKKPNKLKMLKNVTKVVSNAMDGSPDSFFTKLFTNIAPLYHKYKQL